MTEAFNRIHPYVFAFYEAVDRLHVAFSTADCEDAYNRLQRLRNRYVREKANLAPSEEKALSKVLDNDVFIRNLLEMRVMGEHVENPRMREVRLYTTGAPIYMPVETSAAAFYAAPIFRFDDDKGRRQAVDHLRNLDTAKERIRNAVSRAMNNNSE